MLLEFSIQNYRSFKDEHTFSLVAESSKSKNDNVSEQKLSNSDDIRLLKSAVIYGPNASGKSNLLKAFSTLKKMTSSLARAGEPIEYYDPFQFDTSTREAPTVFKVTFIGPGNHKYIYQLTYNWKEVLDETLDYFPKGQTRSLFKRIKQETLIDLAKLGTDFRSKTLKVLNNQTILSKFGTVEPDDFFTPIYLYFKERYVVFGHYDLSSLNARHAAEMVLSKSPKLLSRLNKLIKIADTKIEEVVLKEEHFSPLIVSGHKFKAQFTEKKYKSTAKHKVFSNNVAVGETELPFSQESKGTNVLLVLGTVILDVLEKGGLFLIDEIDTSLHPKLAKFLVLLFKHPIANPKNSQLVFTTHETTFLDKDLFRKDQIWFVEKNNYGESELFSVQDFDNVRENTPFEKWYLAGKFGGLPEIKEIEFIFGNE